MSFIVEVCMKRLLMLFSIITPILLFSQTRKITVQYLVNSQWSDFIFTDDGKVSNHGYFGGELAGDYLIKDYELVVTFKSGNHIDFDKIGNIPVKYHLISVKNEFYSERLVTNDIKGNYSVSINLSRRVPEGTILIDDSGVDIYVLNSVKGSAVSNIRVRDFPDLNSNIYSFQYFDEKPLTYYKKGLAVSVQGRTIKKYKIDNYENYWYIVDLTGLCEYDTYELKDKTVVRKTKYLWVYGEFIKFDK